MRIHVISLFPELVRASVDHGVVGSALKKGIWELGLINPRAFTDDVHHTVDDRPFGGADGMLMMAEPLAKAVDKAVDEIRARTKEQPALAPRVIHLSPRGRLFNDQIAREWAEEGAKERNSRDLILVASRYAGVDQRFIDAYCDDEISIGDFVVSGGELPAAIVIDAVVRHLPNVLGNHSSSDSDSFKNGLLECDQYTRPREWRGRAVPDVLFTGHHAEVKKWADESSLAVTRLRRPDLLK